jgi:pyruvate/2-oxoglutarate/acetoin dehydrogenase E1 component
MSNDPKPINMITAINRALHDAMAEDATVVCFGEDLADDQGGGVFEATKGLSTKFGDKRVRSTPISEQAIMGAGIGAALGGLKPVVEIMLMNFTTVAMDMIVNHAAKLRFMSGGRTSVPLTIRTMTGAGLGLAGQHSDMLEVWFAHTAGIKVVVPSSPSEAYGLLSSCIFDPDPCLFIEPLGIYRIQGPPPVPGARIPLGKANVVRSGADVSVITYGRQVNDTIAAADQLAAEGLDIEIVDLRTISPLDIETVIASVRKTGRAVIVHEAVLSFGPGAEIATLINEALFGQLKAPVRRVASNDSPVPYSKPLETAFMPTVETIAAAIRETARAREMSL